MKIRDTQPVIYPMTGGKWDVNQVEQFPAGWISSYGSDNDFIRADNEVIINSRR